MKQLKVYLTAKYDKSTDKADWCSYLWYKGAVGKKFGTVSNIGSHTRALLYALYKTLSFVNERCDIEVISKVKLSLNNIEKSSNCDILAEIDALAARMMHCIKFSTSDEIDALTKQWDKQYGNKRDRVKKKTNASGNNATGTQEIHLSEAATRLMNRRHPGESDDDFYERMRTESRCGDYNDDLLGESNGAWVPGSGGY